MKNRKLRLWVKCIAIGIFALTASIPVFADSAVVPAIYTDADGNSQNTIPWNNACESGIRYQQVYEDADIPDNVTISAIRYRQDVSSGGAFSDAAFTGVIVSLSTTSVDTTTMSTTFANNIGPDELLVYSGDLSLSSAVSSEVPRPFDIEIPFQAPFDYTGGNLLVDILMESCTNNNFLTDAASSATTLRMYDYDSSSESGSTGANTAYGLVTQFELGETVPVDITPVPVLTDQSRALLIGLLLLAGLAIIRRKFVY